MRKYKVLSTVKHEDEHHHPGAELRLQAHVAGPLLKVGAVQALGGEERTEGTSLPEDFPGKLPLEAAGISTLEELREMTTEEIGGIKGIGRATVEKIEAALKAGA